LTAYCKPLVVLWVPPSSVGHRQLQVSNLSSSTSGCPWSLHPNHITGTRSDYDVNSVSTFDNHRAVTHLLDSWHSASATLTTLLSLPWMSPLLTPRNETQSLSARGASEFKVLGTPCILIGVEQNRYQQNRQVSDRDTPTYQANLKNIYVSSRTSRRAASFDEANRCQTANCRKDNIIVIS